MATDPLLNTKKTLGEIAEISQKYEGYFTKAGKAVSGFMSAQDGFKGFAKSFLYTFRGSFTILNKFKTGLIVTGKVYDTTMGQIMKKNSLLGKGIKKLNVLKMPNFAERLNLPSFKSMGKGMKNLLNQMDSIGADGGTGRGLRGVMSDVGTLTKLKGGQFLDKRQEAFGERLDQIKSFGKGAREKGGAALSWLKKNKFKWIGKSAGLILGVMKLARTILAKAFNFFIISMLVIMAVGTFLKVFWSTVQSLYTGFMKPFEGFYAGIETALHTIWDSFSTIIDFFMGDASLLDVAYALLDLMVASAYVLLKFAYTIGLAGLSALFQVGMDLGESILDFFSSLTWEKWALGALVALGAMVLWMYGFPIIVPALITAGVMIVAKWLWDKLSDWDVFHAGGTSHGGMALVGEKGPEFVNLPAGSKVHSNRKSRTMVGGGGGVTNINITINARDTSDGEMRRIASKIGDMVNNKINRSTSSRTMG